MSEDTAQPTHTRIPGGATAIYQTVVAEQEASGYPTFTPGFDAVDYAVTLTLSAMDRLPSPSPDPTATRVPSIETMVYQQLVATQEALGMQTATPGVDIDDQVATLVERRLNTATPTETRTPQPTHTARPPVPGFATDVFNGVNQTLEARGYTTNTPNPDNRAATAIARTIAYTWRPGTVTPLPASTEAPEPTSP